MKLALDYGIAYNSPHGQNFLVELDGNKRPTGRIFIRDYTDANFYGPVLRAQGGVHVLKMLETYRVNKVYEDKVIIGMNPFYTGQTTKPSWVPSIDRWKTSFLTSTKGLLRSLLFSSPKRPLDIMTYDNCYWTVQADNPQTKLGYASWMRRLHNERRRAFAGQCQGAFF